MSMMSTSVCLHSCKRACFWRITWRFFVGNLESTVVLPLTCNSIVEETNELIKLTETKQYAGQTIRTNRKIIKGSIEEKIFQQQVEANKKRSNLDNILQELGGKKEISTLEKSRLDWANSKEEYGDEELARYKGSGYLDKQKFLLEADYRQFEIERDLRNKQRRTTAPLREG